jgi:hypothetical protein
MAQKKNQKKRDVRRKLRGAIAAAVAEAYPGRTAEFTGGVERSRMATRGPTMGFRIKDNRGKYHSNINWFDPTYEGEVNAAWVSRAVTQSNG